MALLLRHSSHQWPPNPTIVLLVLCAVTAVIDLFALNVHADVNADTAHHHHLEPAGFKVASTVLNVSVTQIEQPRCDVTLNCTANQICMNGRCACAPDYA